MAPLTLRMSCEAKGGKRISVCLQTKVKTLIMPLYHYFQKLIESVEASSEITNQGKDDAGFFKPTRAILLQQLNMLKDLHGKPMAKPMLKTAWKFVVEHVPPEMLVMTSAEKAALKKLLD